MNPTRSHSPHRPCTGHPRRRRLTVAQVVLGWFLLIPLLTAQTPSPAPAPTATSENKVPALEPICIIPESYKMRPEIFVLARGARQVGYTLMRETSSGLEPYTRVELRNSGMTWQQCLKKGEAAATRHLKTLEPTLHRDERGVITHAHFRSDNPLTASIFLSPEFLPGFADTLGKELYVAIPDRFNVFVFPKLSSSIKKSASKMAILYKESLYPVSREVFALSKEGIRVIGKF